MRVLPNKMSKKLASSVVLSILKKSDLIQMGSDQTISYVFSDNELGMIVDGKGDLIIRRVHIDHTPEILEVETDLGDFTLDQSVTMVKEPLLYLCNDLLVVKEKIRTYSVPNSSLKIKCRYRDDELFDFFFECEQNKPVDSLVEDIYNIYDLLGLSPT